MLKYDNSWTDPTVMTVKSICLTHSPTFNSHRLRTEKKKRVFRIYYKLYEYPFLYTCFYEAHMGTKKKK